MIRLVLLFVLAITVNAATPKCGIRSVNPPMPDRLFGGRDALPGEFPWQASLQTISTGAHRCGGSLINDQWVLCAAHCADGISASTYNMVLGKLHRLSKDETERHFKIEKIIKHEKWTGTTGTLQNDVSLFKLAEKVDFEKDKHLVPICLAPSGLNVTGMTCTTSGWGRTSLSKPAPDVLQTISDKIVTNEVCEKENGQVRHIVDGMICSGGFTEGRGACYGDSGGPLQCKIEDAWTQVGIVSWGKTCAHVDHADVYTRVSYYHDWIADKIKSNS